MVTLTSWLDSHYAKKRNAQFTLLLRMQGADADAEWSLIANRAHHAGARSRPRRTATEYLVRGGATGRRHHQENLMNVKRIVKFTRLWTMRLASSAGAISKQRVFPAPTSDAEPIQTVFPTPENP